MIINLEDGRVKMYSAYNVTRGKVWVKALGGVAVQKKAFFYKCGNVNLLCVNWYSATRYLAGGTYIVNEGVHVFDIWEGGKTW